MLVTLKKTTNSCSAFQAGTGGGFCRRSMTCGYENPAHSGEKRLSKNAGHEKYHLKKRFSQKTFYCTFYKFFRTFVLSKITFKFFNRP
jgi:hypothetical protein